MDFTDTHVAEMAEVVEKGINAAQSELFVINPTRTAITQFVTSLTAATDSPTIRLFVDESSLKPILDDFLIASRLADLVNKDQLVIRTLDEVPRAQLLLTKEVLVSVVESGGSVVALPSTDASFVTSTYEEYSRRWDRSADYSLRTPPLSHVRETMAEDIGDKAVEDFNRSLETLDKAEGDGQGLDEVSIALLVAANNRELLYDISRWGEDVRLASKATFSRTKNKLESAGVIDTEKVPIEMGRPRLRLVLGNGTLLDADIETVVQKVSGELS
ncbi:transcriptional regulator TbsP [Halovenus rubra]|uniref:Transcriptional regulator TbsP n=2 Tax=Halovenus rubra TaxID=869890 RepID=A0ACC7DY34_9EURY|nr:DUF5821 family protein [Halovenus rubra]